MKETPTFKTSLIKNTTNQNSYKGEYCPFRVLLELG